MSQLRGEKHVFCCVIFQYHYTTYMCLYSPGPHQHHNQQCISLFIKVHSLGYQLYYTGYKFNAFMTVDVYDLNSFENPPSTQMHKIYPERLF